MKKLLFILLLLINNLFAETPTELDLQVLKDLGIDSSFLNEPSLQRAYNIVYSSMIQSLKIWFSESKFKPIFITRSPQRTKRSAHIHSPKVIARHVPFHTGDGFLRFF